MYILHIFSLYILHSFTIQLILDICGFDTCDFAYSIKVLVSLIHVRVILMGVFSSFKKNVIFYVNLSCKILVLDNLRCGESASSVGKGFGVNESTIGNIRMRIP